MADYTVLIKTLLDTSGMQAKINEAAKNIPPVKIPMKIELNVNDAEIQARIKEIQEMAAPKTQNYFGSNGEMNKVIETYNGNLGESVVITKNLVAATEEEEAHWVQTVKYTNEEQVAIQKLLLAQEANTKLLEQQTLSEQKLSAETAKRVNSLAIMEARNKVAYNSAPVQQMIAAESALRTSVQGGTASQVELDVAINNTNTAYQKQIIASNTAAQVTDSFGRTIEKNTLKVMQWMVATTLIYGSLREIGEGVKYIEDLNQAMTNIGMVTGQTQNELSGMAQQFNDMAKQFGVDTLSISTGATEWIRQGKTAAETTQLLASSTMMSKLGNLEAADATDKLIAVTNAYNISAEDSIGVVDTLISLDNSFATSTGR